MTQFQGKYRVETTRLEGWDYTNPGAYFVTICSQDRVPFFGDIVETRVVLSPVGEIAQQFWHEIPRHFSHVALDAFVVMPNHIHGIIVITSPPNRPSRGEPVVETRHVASLQQPNRFGPLRPGSLQAIVHAYKSTVTRECRKQGHSDFAWQPRFYEHIIRHEKTLIRIRQYIHGNPLQWAVERE